MVSRSPVSGRHAARALMRAVLMSTSRSMDRHSFSALGTGSWTVLPTRVFTLRDVPVLTAVPKQGVSLTKRD